MVRRSANTGAPVRLAWRWASSPSWASRAQCHSFSMLQHCRMSRSRASGLVRRLVMNRWRLMLRLPLLCVMVSVITSTIQARADSNLPLCVHVPSSSEELSPELKGVSAWDLNHNRGLVPLSNHFKAALRSRHCRASWP
jgi:hypothetical protein